MESRPLPVVMTIEGWGRSLIEVGDAPGGHSQGGRHRVDEDERTFDGPTRGWKDKIKLAQETSWRSVRSRFATTSGDATAAGLACSPVVVRRASNDLRSI